MEGFSYAFMDLERFEINCGFIKGTSRSRTQLLTDKLSIGLEPKLADYQSKEHISIPN